MNVDLRNDRLHRDGRTGGNGYEDARDVRVIRVGGIANACCRRPTQEENVGTLRGAVHNAGLEVVSDRCSRPALSASFPKAAKCGIAFTKEASRK